MNTREYLNQAFELDRMIEANKQELAHLENLTSSIRSIDATSELIEHNGQGDPVGKLVAKIVDLEAEIKRETQRYLQLKIEIRQLIASVSNERHKSILQARFLNFKSFKVIADDFHLGLRQTHRQFHDALTEVSQKLKMRDKSP